MATIIFRGIAFAILSLCCAGAEAASYRVEGNRLIISGTIDGDHEFATFTRHLRDNPAVDTVVLKGFAGGVITHGSFMTIPKLIRERKLATEIDGPCFGTCAFTFLAGVRRGVAPGADPKKSFVGFRGISGYNGQPAKELKPGYVSALRRYTGGRMPTALAEKAFDLPRYGLLIFFDDRLLKNSKEPSVVICEDIRREETCTGQPDLDVIKAGVFTH